MWIMLVSTSASIAKGSFALHNSQLSSTLEEPVSVQRVIHFPTLTRRKLCWANKAIYHQPPHQTICSRTSLNDQHLLNPVQLLLLLQLKHDQRFLQIAFEKMQISFNSFKGFFDHFALTPNNYVSSQFTRENKLASSVDAIAISKIWLNDWQG